MKTMTFSLNFKRNRTLQVFAYASCNTTAHIKFELNFFKVKILFQSIPNLLISTLESHMIFPAWKSDINILNKIRSKTSSLGDLLEH